MAAHPKKIKSKDDHNKALWGATGLYGLKGFADARFEYIINDPHKKMIIFALYIVVLSFVIMNKKRRPTNNN